MRGLTYAEHDRSNDNEKVLDHKVNYRVWVFLAGQSPANITDHLHQQTDDYGYEIPRLVLKQPPCVRDQGDREQSQC